MSAQLSEAMKTAKTIQQELVQNENRLAAVQDQIETAKRQKEKLDAEIQQKGDEYKMMMDHRDGETKKLRDAVITDREQLENDRKDFLKVLQDFQVQRNELEAKKEAFKNDLAKSADAKNKVNDFIVAVQRAYSLIS